jgi:hypothetical protein
MSTSVTGRFRDLINSISPTALQGPIGQRFQYVMAVLFDALGDAVAYAVRERFPDVASEDMLPWLGADRQIARGPIESSVSYRQRLKLWLDLWKLAGNPRSILLGLFAYFSPDNSLTIETVDTHGDFFTLPPGQTIPPLPLVVPTQGTWDWDSQAPPWYGADGVWWRLWVVIFPDPSLGWNPTQKWGDGSTWGDGQAWGFGGDPGAAIGIRAVVAEWLGTAWVPWIIFSWDPTAFLATTPGPSARVPDGTWGHWGVPKPTLGSSVQLYSVGAFAGAAKVYLPGGPITGGGQLHPIPVYQPARYNGLTAASYADGVLNGQTALAQKVPM